ncbi:MAG: hypothetical protein OXH92_01245 [Bryobacterales bacterium]|nr:hypothetical protein [Bryobacterales bacterium]MDE0293123.1 hypothetical protein [Bryobacterales bacterium]MDE0432609.1 hypothetical protein [Bryobacterales bacterium]
MPRIVSSLGIIVVLSAVPDILASDAVDREVIHRIKQEASTTPR